MNIDGIALGNILLKIIIIAIELLTIWFLITAPLLQQIKKINEKLDKLIEQQSQDSDKPE